MNDNACLVRASTGGNLLLICGLYLLIPGLLFIGLTGLLGLIDSAVGVLFIVSGLSMRRATRTFAPAVIAIIFGAFMSLIPHNNSILASFFLPLGGWSPAVIFLNFCLNGLVPLVAGILGLVGTIKQREKRVRMTYSTIISSLCFLFGAICLFGSLIAWVYYVSSGPPKLGGVTLHPYRQYAIPLATAGSLLLIGGIALYYLKKQAIHHNSL
jgi:hypothetical protein